MSNQQPQQRPEVPFVPGLKRATNPYLAQVMRQQQRAGRPQTAPTSQQVPAPPQEPQPPQTARPTTAPSFPEAPKNPLLEVTCKQPEYVTKDREVLRYYAYFQEPVVEGGDIDSSGFRVRKFTIRYFTADGTMSVEEPRVANSGLQQGSFIRKQKVPRPTRRGGAKLADHGQGEFYGPNDLLVGGTLELYGRVFKIVDADEYTRDYYRRVLGMDLALPEGYPDDGYAARRSLLEAPRTHRRDIKGPKPVPYPQRDTRVLRFFCAYEDQLAGGRRQYNLYYYLEDDTAEVKEVSEEGVQKFPNLLKRQKIPKGGNAVPVGDTQGRDPQRPIVDTYTWRDLKCGSAVTVYGRHLLLLSADASTLAWYESQGIRQRPLQISIKDTMDPIKLKVAPRNGFGTDDDLFSLGLSLEPAKYQNKEARANKSAQKFVGDRNHVLHFKVHVIQGGKEDTTRELILNYFQNDDTVSIYEPPVRNSGVQGGAFLTRGRYKKYIERISPAGINRTKRAQRGSLSRYLRPFDFLVTSKPVTFEDAGACTRLFTVKVVGYDDYTLKLLEDELGPKSQRLVKVAMDKLSETFKIGGVAVRATFRQADNEGCGVLKREDFIHLVRSMESSAQAVYRATDNELEVVLRYFTEGGGLVEYEDFVDTLVICAPISVYEQAKEAVGAATLTLEERMFKILSKNFVDGSHGAGAFRKTFRQLDSEGTHQVDFAKWVQALQKHDLIGLMSKTSASTMLLQYDTKGIGNLNYKALLDIIFPGDFVEDDAIEPEDEDATATTTTTRASTAATNAAASPEKPTKLEAPTVKKYLADLKEQVFTCNGDTDQQLLMAMQSFSSAFSRNTRKRILRKIWIAFDSDKNGHIDRSHFYQAVRDTACEFHIDFDSRLMTTLGEYIFPDADKSTVNYEDLLEAICSRDLRKVKELRETSLQGVIDYDKLFGGKQDSRTRDFGGTLKVVGVTY